ncbi:MAG: hypothetical protein WC459_03245 [Patescibacteria group bacterium]
MAEDDKNLNTPEEIPDEEIDRDVSEDGNFSPEEVEEIMGDDIENLRDDEHPEEMDTDTEGTGVDEPDMVLAAWDDEIEPEDRDDLVLAKINFEEITAADREVYLGMVSLREVIRVSGLSQEVIVKIDDLTKQCSELKAGLSNDSRAAFLGIVTKKLKELKS